MAGYEIRFSRSQTPRRLPGPSIPELAARQYLNRVTRHMGTRKAHRIISYTISSFVEILNCRDESLENRRLNTLQLAISSKANSVTI